MGYGRKYTPEERAFFREYVPGHSYKEIADEFNRRFQPSITVGKVNNYIGNNGLNTGRTGRFNKGSIPPNKGRKGYCAPGCEKGHFPKGHIAANNLPIGSAKLREDGYLWVKVQDGHGRFNWRQKHVLVWEAANGPIPPDHCILFLDANRDNIALENLRLITRSKLVRLNQNGLIFPDADLTKTGIVITDLISTMAGKKKQLKKRGHL